MPNNQLVSPETWDLIKALLARDDILVIAKSAFQHCYPDAPAQMIEGAVFHVFCDGIGAALNWVAAAEKFLQDPTHDIDYGATSHVVYHLHTWLQFQALLPMGRQGILERLEDVKLFISESDPKAALAVIRRLEESFCGSVRPPEIE